MTEQQKPPETIPHTDDALAAAAEFMPVVSHDHTDLPDDKRQPAPNPLDVDWIHNEQDGGQQA